MPIPDTLEQLGWISVENALPCRTSAVLVTDGTNIAVAHFSKRYEAKEGENEQFERWFNRNPIDSGTWVKYPTHWMPFSNIVPNNDSFWAWYRQ